MRSAVAFAVAACAATGLLADQGAAEVVLTVNTHTADELSFTLSGTFDESVIGDEKQWLAVKNDWTNNLGTSVDWIADSVGFAQLGWANLNVVENTIMFDGLAAPQSAVAATGQSFGDSIFFDAGFDIVAGTEVSGTLTITGPGIFNDSMKDLELLSGYSNQTQDWARMESEIPGPASVLLLGVGVAVSRRRRR